MEEKAKERTLADPRFASLPGPIQAALSEAFRPRSNFEPQAQWIVLLHKLGVSLPLGTTMPTRTFSELKSLLADDGLLKLESSWGLVFFVYENWGWLSKSQRAQLRKPLVGSFDKFGSSTGAFVVAEILGQRYADGDALTILIDLSRTPQLLRRDLVPHGLEKLATSTRDQRLRKEAIERLRVLLHDESLSVRDEARLALARIPRL
jgi:hypothetical protein